MATTTFSATSHMLAGETAVTGSVREFSLRMSEPCCCDQGNGVNPIEMMLSALASCQCVAAQKYAAAHNIAIHEFNVDLDGDIDPEQMLMPNDHAPESFQEVRMRTYIRTSAPPEKIEQFRSFIMGKCPLTRTMLHGVNVVADDIVIELDDDAITETYGHVMAAW